MDHHKNNRNAINHAHNWISNPVAKSPSIHHANRPRGSSDIERCHYLIAQAPRMPSLPRKGKSHSSSSSFIYPSTLRFSKPTFKPHLYPPPHQSPSFQPRPTHRHRRVLNTPTPTPQSSIALWIHVQLAYIHTYRQRHLLDLSLCVFSSLQKERTPRRMVL